MSTAPSKKTTTKTTDTNGKTTKTTDTPILDAILDRQVSYTPFLGKEPITITPRMVLRFLVKPTKTGKVCTEEQAVKFCKLCEARGLNPWEGDAYIVGYDTNNGPEFNLITAHQAFLKRAEVHPEYDGMESGVVVQDDASEEVVEVAGDFVPSGYTLVGGWSRVHFKNRKFPIFRKLRLGIFAKKFGRWLDDPGGMIVKCAEADALRSAFPNSLGGLYLDGDLDEPREAKTHQELKPIKNLDDLSQRITQAKAKVESKKEEPKPEPVQEALEGECDEFGNPLPPVGSMSDWQGNPDADPMR